MYRIFFITSKFSYLIVTSSTIIWFFDWISTRIRVCMSWPQLPGTIIPRIISEIVHISGCYISPSVTSACLVNFTAKYISLFSMRANWSKGVIGVGKDRIRRNHGSDAKVLDRCPIDVAPGVYAISWLKIDANYHDNIQCHSPIK